MDGDGRRRVGRVPGLLEGGETLTQRVAVHHRDGPGHDVRQACPLALQDGGEVAERLAGLLADGGTDDLTVGVDGCSTTTAWLKAGLRWSPSGLICRTPMCCLL